MEGRAGARGPWGLWGGPELCLRGPCAAQGCSEQRSMAGRHSRCAENGLWGHGTHREPSQDAEPVHQGEMVGFPPGHWPHFLCLPRDRGWGDRAWDPAPAPQLRDPGCVLRFPPHPFWALVPTSTGQKMNLYLLSERNHQIRSDQLLSRVRLFVTP